ncbi:MAG: hypothetical protein Q4F97_06495 [Bacteroidales bacterium]|nr:hypothetical protein [Bacteroidales bacterium]
MNYLEAPLVLAVIGYAIYKIFELFVNRPLRSKLIDKIDSSNVKIINPNLKFPNFENSNNASALRVSLLLIGISLGLFISYIIYYVTSISIITFDITTEDIYFPCTGLFGGLGLLISYFVEKKQIEKEKEEYKKMVEDSLASSRKDYDQKEQDICVNNDAINTSRENDNQEQ